MADIKAGEPFGMDSTMLTNIDWTVALNRVSHDLRTDFIYAPTSDLSMRRQPMN